LKICYITVNEGFCNYYRVKFPGEAMQEQGLAEVRFVNPDHTEEFGDGVEWADICVFQYANPVLKFVAMVEYAREIKCGKIFVVEFDDDYFHIDHTNPNYRQFGLSNIKDVWKDGKDGFIIKENKIRLDRMKDAVAAADLVTVTTKNLGDSYRKYNKNIAVLPNCIQPKKMPPSTSQQNRDEVVIGWQGSDSHAGDMASHMKVLEQVKEKYGDKVKFTFMGSSLAKRFFDKVNGEFVPWVRPQQFYRQFAKQHIDIGIVVINDTLFNRNKSNIKWLEYSYYMIPTIATKLPPYSNTMTHGVNGLLWANEDAFYLGLCALVDDSLLRASLAGKANRHVLEKYDINKQAYKWVDAYKQAFFRKRKKLDKA